VNFILLYSRETPIHPARFSLARRQPGNADSSRSIFPLPANNRQTLPMLGRLPFACQKLLFNYTPFARNPQENERRGAARLPGPSGGGSAAGASEIQIQPSILPESCNP
jgi:hypothetical protein